MDITTLAVVVKSDGIAETTDKLNKFTESAQKASDASTRLASDSAKASDDLGKGIQDGAAKGSQAAVGELSKYQQRVIEMQDTYLNSQRNASEKEYQDKVSMYTKLFAQRDAQDQKVIDNANKIAQAEIDNAQKSYDARLGLYTRLFAQRDTQDERATKQAYTTAQAKLIAEQEADNKMNTGRVAAMQTMYRAIEQAKQKEVDATKRALDKQLELEVAYEKASLAGKIRLAEEAQIWASKGVDPVQKVGAAAMAADVGQLSSALKIQQQEAKEAAHQTDGFSLKTAAAKREVLVLAHELSQGQYNRFGSSMMVLAEQTGMAGAVIAAATNPITYTIIVLGLVGLEAYKGAQAFKAMQQTINDTGNFAGQSANNLYSMSEALGQTYHSAHNAQEAITSLNATGKFTSATLYQAGDAALAIARNTGQSLADVTKDLSKVMDNALKYADDYQTTHHTMSASDRERIKSLQEVGNTEAAALEVLKLIRDQSNKTAEEATKNIGILKMAWLGWSDILTTVVQKLDNIGKSSAEDGLLQKSEEAGARVGKAFEQVLKVRNSGDEKAIARAQEILDFNRKQVKEINEQIIAKQKLLDLDRQKGLTGDAAKSIDTYRTANISEMNKTDRAAELTRRENDTFNKVRSDAEKALGNVSLVDVLLGDKKIDTSKLDKDQQLVYKNIQEAYQLHQNKLNKIEEDSKKGDSKGIDDRYRAKLSAIDGQIQAAKGVLKQTELDNELAFTKGEIGKYEFLQKNLEAEKKYFAEEIKLRQEAVKVARPDDRIAKEQDLINARVNAEEKSTEIIKKNEVEANKFLADQRAQATADEVKSLKEKGLFVEAYLKQQEAEGGRSIAALSANVKFSQSQVEANFATGGVELDKWIERLSGSQDALSAAQDKNSADLNNAIGQELSTNATRAYETLKTMTEHVQQDLATKNIFDVIVGDQATINDIVERRVPLVKAAMEQLRQFAYSEGGTPQMQAAFESANGKAQKEIKSAIKLKVDVDTKPIDSLATTIADISSASKGMGDGWKHATDALTGFSSAMKELSKATQEDTEKEGKGTSTRIKAFGTMASAAKNFFGESSAGYKTLDDIAKIAHVARMGMLIAENGMLLYQNGILAIKAVLSALGLPGIGFAAGAAMAAIVAGLGFAVGGGFSSGGDTSQDAAAVQKLQGTGTVTGDVNAKSDSITKSLDLLGKTSDKLFNVNTEMLTNLKSINQGISGLANMVARSTGLTTGSNFNIKEGTLGTTGFLGQALGAGIGGVLGAVGGGAAASSIGAALGTAILPGIGTWVGAALGAIVGKVLGGLWGKTMQSITDSGIQLGGSLVGLKAGQGINQYANVQTTSSSFFGLSKDTSNSVVTQGVDSQVSNAIGQIFTNLDKSLRSAAVVLYGSSDAVGKALDAFILDTTKLSLKGLSGQALQDAINNVLSKAFDQMTTAAFPNLVKFAQSGEGLAQTVIRLAQEFTTVNSVMTALGGKILGFGDAGITAADSLIQAAGGLDKFTTQAEFFIQNFLPEQDQIGIAATQVNKQLGSMGLGFIKTNAQMAAYVKSLDLSTDSGQKQYTALMNLAPAFDVVTKYITKIVDSIKSTQSSIDSDINKIKSVQDGYDGVAYAQEQVTKAQAEYDAATNPTDQIAAANKLRQAITSRYDAEIAMINNIKSQMQALSAFKLEVDTARQTILSARSNYDPVAYAVTKVTKAQDALNKATNPADQLAAAKNLKDAVMNRYTAETAAIKKADQQQQDAINAAGRAAVDAQNKLNDAYRAIGSYALSLLTSTQSPLSNFAQKSYNQGAYNDLVTALKSGDITNAGQYQSTANSLLKSAMDTSQDAVEYARTFYQVLGTSRDLGNKAQTNQTWQDVTISNQQALNDIQDKALGELDGIDKIIDKSNADLQKKLDDYAGKTTTWQDATLIAQNKALDGLALLNITLTDVGTKIVNTLNSSSTTSGTTTDTKSNAITPVMKSQTTTSSDGVMLSWTAPTNQSQANTTTSLQAVSNNVAELRSDMKAGITQVALNTSSTSNWLKRWNGDGMPETRTWVSA